MKKIFSLIVLLIVLVMLKSCFLTKKTYNRFHTDNIKQRISKKKDYAMVITTDYDTLIMSFTHNMRQGIPDTKLTGIIQRYKDGNLVFQTSVYEGSYTGIYEIYSSINYKIKERGLYLSGEVIKRIIYNEEGEVIEIKKSEDIRQGLLNFR